MICVVFSLCHVQALVNAVNGILSVLCAVCSHEPRLFAPSMPRFARVSPFARCGRFAPAGPASNRKLPCCDCRFWSLIVAPRSIACVWPSANSRGWCAELACLPAGLGFYRALHTGFMCQSMRALFVSQLHLCSRDTARVCV